MQSSSPGIDRPLSSHGTGSECPSNAQGEQNGSECPTNTLQNSFSAHGVPSQSICPGHVSSIFPIACADEKRSATAQMIVFMLAGLRGNSLSGGAGASARARRALGVCSTCVYYRNVAARRGGARPVTEFQSPPRPNSRSLSPARVGRAGGALLGRVAGRFMLAQTIVTLLRQQGDARHRRSRPQCWRVCKV